jgi:outer membrane protein assembly factor BamB
MKLHVLLAAGIIILCGNARVGADNWPEFRGPTGQGLVANDKLPVEWSATKNVTWKQPIPGKAWSSPIVQEGRIYLTTAVLDESKKELSLRTLCLDAKSGKQLWDREVFHYDAAKAPRIHNKASHANPTPLTDGQHLYVHYGHQGTACLDLDGKIIWRSSELAYKPVHGNGGTPVLVDDALVFSCDGGDKQFVAALDRKTGKPLWKTDRKTDAPKKFAFATPLVIQVKDQKQVISQGAGFVAAYDPKNGKEIWKVRYGEGYSVVPRPVFGHGLVFVASGFDAPSLLAIRSDGQGDVTDSHVAWKLTKGAPLTPSPLLVGDELYLVSDQGIASCLDAKTGKVHWQERVVGNYSASPLVADGKIYFQNEQGVGVVVKAATKFEPLAKNPIGEPTLASYAAADGALFIRTEKNLYRVEASR